MTTYLLESTLESGLSLLVLLGVYKLCLEDQPMHRLKRVYLLGTLLLSLAGPVVSVKVPPDWAIPALTSKLLDDQLPKMGMDWDKAELYEPLPAVKGNVPVITIPDSNVPTPYWLWFYSAITALMLARFVRNLYVLIRQIWTNPTEPFYEATLVKLPGNGLPYTFLHYLFVPADAYDRGKIEAELVAHELGHIRQRHSLDILLVEIVLCFGWFNPLVFWLKQAIQRNHEFLADEAVNETYLNVPGYQQLLLSKLTMASPTHSLTSTLTFNATKQRLLMMTKQTSPARTRLTASGIALLFLMLTVVLTGTAPAQKPIFPLQSETTPPKPRILLSVTEIESRFGNVLVNATSRELGSAKQKITFNDLTTEQKARVIYLEGVLPAVFNAQEFDALKNANRYSVWVDGKRVRHFDRTTLQASDIVTYNIRRMYKNARRPDAYHYQVDLLTDSAANAHALELQAKPTLLLLTREQMERRQARMGK